MKLLSNRSSTEAFGHVPGHGATALQCILPLLPAPGHNNGTLTQETRHGTTGWSSQSASRQASKTFLRASNIEAFLPCLKLPNSQPDRHDVNTCICAARPSWSVSPMSSPKYLRRDLRRQPAPVAKLSISARSLFPRSMVVADGDSPLVLMAMMLNDRGWAYTCGKHVQRYRSIGSFSSYDPANAGKFNSCPGSSFCFIGTGRCFFSVGDQLQTLLSWLALIEFGG